MDIYMYWLSTLYTMGSRKQNILLNYFGDAKAAYHASIEELRQIPGFTENNIRVVQKNKDMSVTQHGFDTLGNMGISFIPRNHESFPYLLSTIPDAPIGLFCLGKFPNKDFYRVAIIGSRKCSEYGLNTARKFSEGLANNKVVVVSGMARGIDSMSHQEVINNGGLTIAVLGCGPDICYPPENRELRDKIAKNGCVISEYPPGVPPHARHFPARNRIISGLSHLLIVVEAAKRSGTLITVDQALEQGRSVMAVPGNITNEYSQGTNSLIKQGAEPVCSTEDILEVLGLDNLVVQTRLIDDDWDTPQNTQEKNFKKFSGKNPEKIVPETATSIAPEEKLVYDVLDFVPQSLEDIVVKTNSEVYLIQYLLTMLELKGFIRKLPGARYEKI